MIPVVRSLHGFVNGNGQIQFPALSTFCRTVFPGAHPLSHLLLLLGKNRETVLHAKPIGELPQLPQGVGPLPKHFSILMTDGVDQKVGMDVRRVNMGGDQHLAVRPGLGSELFRNPVGEGRRDRFLGMEGLGVMIKPNRTVLPVCFPCRVELPCRQLGETVLPTDPFSFCCLLVLHYIRRDTAENSAGLLAVGNEIDRCHYRLSMVISSVSAL